MQRPIVLLFSGLALSLSVFKLSTVSVAAPASSAPTTAPTTHPSEKVAARIDALETFYADLYSKPLKEKNRLSQLVAVTSLSRVGGQALVKKLVGAILESDVLVGQLAWEAVHARQEKLTPADREKWIMGGLDIARRDGFPGVTVAPLLAALSEKPSAALKTLPDLLGRVAAENDPATPDGKKTLEAARDAIASWGDPKLVQILIAKLQKSPKLAPRVSIMLSGLPDAPEATDDANKMRATWGRALRTNKLTPPTTRPSYAGVSTLLPKPEYIEDPSDKKWRKDLELPKLDLDSVDLTICIDATGSMIPTNTYVSSYIETVMRLLRLMSDDVHGGAVYYRHETDEALMLPCCKAVAQEPDSFRTRVVPLMSDPKAFAELLRTQKLTGKLGHGTPIGGGGYQSSGAYAGGIAAAIREMKWGKKAKRIIACTGDDNMTPGSEKTLLALAAKAKEEGFLLIFVVRDPVAAKSVVEASKVATGLEPILYKADIDKLKAASDKGAAKGAADTSTIDGFKGTAFEKMTTRVVQLTLPEGYRPRVPTLLAAMLPILQAQDEAVKASEAAGIEKKKTPIVEKRKAR